MNRLFLIILIYIMFAFTYMVNAQNSTITINREGIIFETFCEEISQQSGIPIFINDSILLKKKIDVNFNNTPIEKAIKQSMDTMYYQLLLWNNSIIIYGTSTIPLYVVKYNIETPIMQNDSNVEKKVLHLKTSRAGVLKKIIVGKKGEAKATKKVEIIASIKSLESEEIIPGASIFIKDLEVGAVADKDGVARLRLKPGKYTLSAASVGLKTQHYRLIILSAGEFQVSLPKKSTELSSINIYGDRQMSILKRDPGIEKVSGRTLRELPVMAGEPDLIKASTMLPGIVSVGEGTPGINVRGGSFDQNAFYLNGIPIFNTYHMLGFFPAFNADLIRDFTIYKGYIPSEYGGKLSSVFDINTRKGNRKKFSMHGGISPMAANLVVSVPIIKDKLSVIASGRKSYSDWILKKVNDNSINKSSVTFDDFSFGLYYDLEKTQISLFAYHSNDFFSFSNDNKYDYSNNGASLNIKQVYNNKLSANYSVVASKYDFASVDKIEVSQGYEHSYNIMQNEIKAELTYKFNDNHKITGGYNGTFYNLGRGVINPTYKSKISTLDLGKEQGIDNAMYISDVWSPIENLELLAGFRYSVYNYLGPKDVYLYSDNQIIDETYITDTINYGNNKVITTNHFPEFRFAASYKLNKKSNIKTSFTQMHQSLFMLNPSATVIPSSQWKLADYHLNPSRSNQVSLGYFRDIIKYGMEASVEGFYKHTKDYTEFRDGAEFLSSEKVELSTLQGKQTSYGVEFMLRRRGDYLLTGWLAYTYSKSTILIEGDQPWQNVNSGIKYPSAYDIPHSVNVFLNIKISKRVNFSTTLNYQTGRPITFPISMYYINTLSYVDFSERNAYRIPHYFRMDASLTIEGNLKKDKFMHSSFVISVYNLTGRDNPYSVFFTTNSYSVQTHQYSVIAIPVITASWIFKLGNFDAN